MNLITIQLVNSCNRDCYYCTARRWMKPLGFRFPYNGEPKFDTKEEEEASRRKLNDITADSLFRWLDKYLDPAKWFIELTGGEPCIHPEIDSILYGLEKRGYQGVIKTNGSVLVPKIKGFVLFSAWHFLQDFPLVYDIVSIIKNDRDRWHEKVHYCIDNSIPYVTVALNEEYVTGAKFDGTGELPEHHLLEYLYMNSMGQLGECPPHTTEGDAYRIQDMAWHEPRDMTQGACRRCYHALYGSWQFTPEMKAKIKRDWESEEQLAAVYC